MRFSEKYLKESKNVLPDKAIIIASHQRSGTHLSIDLLRKQFLECQTQLSFLETRHHAYLTLDHLSAKHRPHISQKEARSILAKAKVPIIKTHCLPDFEYLGHENIEFVKDLRSKSVVFYIVRDGRDVMCSVHLWRQKFHPKAYCSLSDFLRLSYSGMTYPEIWANHVKQWLMQPGIHVLKYENIVQNPLDELKRIGLIIDLSPLYKEPILPKKKVPSNRWEDYFLRLTRQFESTAIDRSKYFKNYKNWKDIFSIEDKCFFNKMAGDVLNELGYE